MLRSRSVSRSVGRSVASVAIIGFSLAITSRASAGKAVVVAGPAGSARVAAITSELRARGLEVITEAPAEATATTAAVRVGADGSVLVVVGERRETFDAAAEGDSVLARRVAETIRAVDTEAPEPPATLPAPAPAPPSPAPAPAPAEPPASPAPSPRRALSPARTFALSGTWLLSVDDALPLVALGGTAPLSTSRMLRLGDPSYGATTSPKPISIDAALVDGLTVGGTVLFQYGLTGSILGGSARIGYAIPLGSRLAVWPRLGVAYERAVTDAAWALESRTDVTAEARLVWTVSCTWALTLGPSVALAVQSNRQPGLGFAADAVNAPARISVALGLTGRIRDSSAESADADAAEPRFFLGVERTVPLFRYAVETAVAGEDRAGSKANGPPTRGDVGTVDATSITPQSPSLAFDMVSAPPSPSGPRGALVTCASPSRQPISSRGPALRPRSHGPSLLESAGVHRSGARSRSGHASACATRTPLPRARSSPITSEPTSMASRSSHRYAA